MSTTTELGRDAATFVGMLAIGWVLATVFAKPSLAPAPVSVPCSCSCTVGLPPPAVILPATAVTP